MANDYIVKRAEMEMIADKFREKNDNTQKVVFPKDFVSSIDEVYESGRKSMYKIVEEDFTSIRKEDLEGVKKIRAFFCYVYTNLVNVELPESLENIGSSSFRECTNLKSITIPDTVESAGDRVFYHCSSLEGTLSLGNIYSINAHFCNGCTGLTRVIFGKNLSAINGYAFGSCTGIKIFDFSACTIVPTLSALTAFNGIKNFTAIVPDALYSRWIKATNWSSIADKIKLKSQVQVEFRIVDEINYMYNGTYTVSYGTTWREWVDRFPSDESHPDEPEWRVEDDENIYNSYVGFRVYVGNVDDVIESGTYYVIW